MYENLMRSIFGSPNLFFSAVCVARRKEGEKNPQNTNTRCELINNKIKKKNFMSQNT